MAKNINNHRDILGNTIELGSYIAVSHRNELKICKVMKLSNVMMRVWPVKSPVSNYIEASGWLVHPDQAVVLDGAEALAYVLKH